MANYDSKKDDSVREHIDEVIEIKVARMVNNQQMPDSETNWNRGYIAAYRDFFTFYTKELPKKLNER